MNLASLLASIVSQSRAAHNNCKDKWHCSIPTLFRNWDKEIENICRTVSRQWPAYPEIYIPRTLFSCWVLFPFPLIYWTIHILWSSPYWRHPQVQVRVHFVDSCSSVCLSVVEAGSASDLPVILPSIRCSPQSVSSVPAILCEAQPLSAGARRQTQQIVDTLLITSSFS